MPEEQLQVQKSSKKILIINNDEPPVQSKHLSWYIKDTFCTETITLVELVENFYRLNEYSLIPKIEIGKIVTYPRKDILKSSHAILLEVALTLVNRIEL